MAKEVPGISHRKGCVRPTTGGDRLKEVLRNDWTEGKMIKGNTMRDKVTRRTARKEGNQ